VAIRRGELGAQSTLTLDEAAASWLDGAKGGAIRNRSGDPYKPSVLREYERSLRRHLLPALGQRRLAAITRLEVQKLADELLASGLDPSTVRNALMPLRVIYRRAVSRSVVSVNPTQSLELPAPRGKRERFASPGEAEQLLAALRPADRALWATALYAGLRRGELVALQWEDVDLEAGVISVRRSWDPRAGFVETKSGAGRRRVPIASVLAGQLAELRSRVGGDGFVFAAPGGGPLNADAAVKRARRDWAKAGLDSILLHECRHSFASLMIAAGVNPKALSTYIGHSSIAITLDRYGHLMPGNEADAASRLDSYLTSCA
jgi:integrase